MLVSHNVSNIRLLKTGPYLDSGSQEERISILKMALTEKGVLMGSHYDLTQPSHSTGGSVSADASQPARTAPAPSGRTSTTGPQPTEGVEDGVFL